MKTKQFLVALHTLNYDQVFEELHHILTPNGAHGVILVNNGGHIKSGPIVLVLNYLLLQLL